MDIKRQKLSHETDNTIANTDNITISKCTPIPIIYDRIYNFKIESYIIRLKIDINSPIWYNNANSIYYKIFGKNYYLINLQNLLI